MARITDLAAVVEREVAEYVWDEEDSNTYLLKDEARRMYAVLLVPIRKPQDSMTIMAAQVIDDKVVIDVDLTDKPLYEALLQAGVPREQIILAYKGEAVSNPVS